MNHVAYGWSCGGQQRPGPSAFSWRRTQTVAVKEPGRRRPVPSWPWRCNSLATPDHSTLDAPASWDHQSPGQSPDMGGSTAVNETACRLHCDPTWAGYRRRRTWDHIGSSITGAPFTDLIPHTPSGFRLLAGSAVGVLTASTWPFLALPPYCSLSLSPVRGRTGIYSC